MLFPGLVIVKEAEKLMIDEWNWHRPDNNFTLPLEYALHAKAAKENIQKFLSDAFWTQNSLRKYGQKEQSHD